jgi:hypothetical protein
MRRSLCLAFVTIAVACVQHAPTGNASDTAAAGSGGSTTASSSSSASGGSSGTQAQAGSGGDSAASTGSGSSVNCDIYCKSIQKACTGGNVQYLSEDSCIKTCSALPPGKAGETTGNTLACRVYHTAAAQSAPATHCPHAGPAGSGTCGKQCEAFCTIVQFVCTNASSVFPDHAACLKACDAFPTVQGGYYATMTSGNSVDCRIYHATAAATSPNTHCPHAKSNSDVCK